MNSFLAMPRVITKVNTQIFFNLIKHHRIWELTGYLVMMLRGATGNHYQMSSPFYA